MVQNIPQPTNIPQARGLNEYLQMSSASNPAAANYIPNVSTSSNQLNAYGAPLGQQNPYGTTNRVVETNTKTGQFVDKPAPGPAPQPSGPNLKDRNSNPGSGWFWDSADGWKQSGGGGGAEDYSKMISELYDPALQLANQQEQTVRGGFEGDKTNLLNRIAQSLGEYQTQGDELLGSTDKEQTTFNSVIENALNQAVRAYQALQQRGNVFYGGASGTGAAMGELAQREFARQQGNINTKMAEGTQQFAEERTKIRSYIDSKRKDLDLFKNEALTTLEQNLKVQLDQIQARRYDIEANRTRDKMAALQSTMAQTQAIADQDKQFRQNLAMAGLQQLQSISSRPFTPAEIKAYMSEFASDFNVTPGQETSDTVANMMKSKPRSYQDEFSTLNPIAAQQTKQPTMQQNGIPMSAFNSPGLSFNS